MRFFSLFMKITLLVAMSLNVNSADIDKLMSLPLFNIKNVEYIGGFRVPDDTYGDSTSGYSEGIITLGKDGKSFYLVGHSHHQAIGEFGIPALVNSLNHKDFNYASKLQPFAKVLSRGATGNPQKIDRISGMEYINGQLYVNANIYYDASGSGTHTTLVVKDASKLSDSSVAGFHSFSALAHASGWISPVPVTWQRVLGGTYITGYSSGRIGIISRLSPGPSAFTFDPLVNDYGNMPPGSIPVTKLLDYELANPLGHTSGDVGDYLNNVGMTNDIWVHLSSSSYGFIVPGTRTYMTVGHNGGLESGIGYKLKRPDGSACPGYCAIDQNDYDNYYWLWDLNDLIDVKANRKVSHEIMPYAHGYLPDIYAHDGINAISGGAIDYVTNTLYVTLSHGDRGQYGWAPTVVAFKLHSTSFPSKPGNTTIRELK